jgi:hypothetical protein
MLAIICGDIGIAHDRAHGNSCPAVSLGVVNPRRSAAPQRVIFCNLIQSVNHPGKEKLGRNTLSLLWRYIILE